jgi:hypothetical protein
MVVSCNSASEASTHSVGDKNGTVAVADFSSNCQTY